VLVSRTVARLAQEYFLEANIPLAINVKPVVIQRIARATGADILTSATVEEMVIRTYSGKWGLKPLMFFDGCSDHFGCSILLRGADFDTLKKVKKLTLVSSFNSITIS
jgi:1-phosphatidylinositol-3-phosphate 5-kinase